MRRALAVLLLTAAWIPGLALADEEARTETRRYGTVIGTATVCRTPESVGVPAGWGGSCFSLDDVSTKVSIAIEDVLGPPVQGYYDFLDSEGEGLTSGTFCDTASLDIPTGAAVLRVYVDGPGDGLVVDGCGIGLAGEVTVTFE